MRLVILFIFSLLLTSCEGFSFSNFLPIFNVSVDTRFEESMLLPSSQPDISISDSVYTIYACGDLHYESTAFNFIRTLNDANDDQSPLLLFLGDLVYGNGRLPIVRSMIDENQSSHSSPCLVAYCLGNHDLYFDQWADYKRYFGSSVYYFTVGGGSFDDLFICLDTGSGTVGNKQREWLESVLSSQRSLLHRHCIVYSHTNLWDTDNSQFPSGSTSVEELMMLSDLFERYDVDIYLCGHDHHREVVQFKQTIYITLDAIMDNFSDASYLKLSLGLEDIQYNFIDL